MSLITLLIGSIIGRGMMRTPIDPANGWMSGVAFGVIGVIVLCVLAKRYGWRSLGGVLAVAIFGVLVEFVGIRTCVPYGCFEYGPLVGPQFMGTFPWALLVIWPLIVMSIIQFVPHESKILLLASFVGGLFLMLFDMMLDPVAVTQGIWSYSVGEGRYGIPWSNFVGWIFTGTISCFLLLKYSPILRGDRFLKNMGRFITGMYAMAFLVVIGLVPIF